MLKRGQGGASAAPNLLLEGPVGPALVRFSMPFVFSTLFQTMYSTVDTIVIGQYDGSAGLSAVSNGSQLMQLAYMLCIGFASAGQVVIAQRIGADERERVEQTAGTLLRIVLGLSCALGLACVAFARALLRLMNTPPEAAEGAAAYVVICGAGLVFTGLYNYFSSLYRGLGDSRHPLIFVIVASLVNLALDVLFIAAFHWGAAGAALATVIGQAVSVAFSVAFMRRFERRFQISSRRCLTGWDRAEASRLTRLGLPIAMQSAAVQISFLFVGYLVNGLGVVASAAFGVMQKLRVIPHVITNAFSTGAGPMIGQNLGAKRLDRASDTVKCCIWLCVCVNLAFIVAFLAAPGLCFRAFTRDAAVMAYAQACMIALAVELPGKMVLPACGALVTAQGFVSFSAALAVIDAFAGRVLLSYLLGSALGFGASGFFLGYTTATYLTAVPVFVYYISGAWKRRKLLIDPAS